MMKVKMILVRVIIIENRSRLSKDPANWWAVHRTAIQEADAIVADEKHHGKWSVETTG